MFELIRKHEHENLYYKYDKQTGLKAIIGIHDTTLGPALGGVRILDYKTEEDAIKDVLRLSEGMSLKASFAGLDLGGGKAVILGDATKIKTEALLRSFGKFVDTFNGQYYTAPDVNTNIYDMETIAKETKNVVALPSYCNGGGDPSECTAYGVYTCMKAACKHLYKNDSLSKRTILLEGIGKVGSYLLKYFTNEGAKVYIADISDKAIKKALSKYNATVIETHEIFKIDTDVYCPCALGATINDKSIDKINCDIVVGSANNQLENSEKHDLMLKNKEILYVPDFIANSGGLINVYTEYKGKYDRKRAMQQIELLYNKCLNLFEKSTKSTLSTNKLAEKISLDRIKNVRDKELAWKL